MQFFPGQKTGSQIDPMDLASDDMLNKLRIAFEQGLAPKVLAAPIFVLWELTGRCPQDCIYCYNRSPKKVEELSGRRLFQLADELIEAKVFSVCLSGGEPMLRREYLDLLNYLGRSGVATGTVLSGAGITPEAATRLARDASTVQISLDGSTAEVHDAVRRRKGSYADAVKAIRLLKDAGKDVQIAFAVTSKNIADFPRVYDLGRSLGVASVRTMKLVLSGKAADTPRELEPSATDYENFLLFCQLKASSEPPVLYSDPTTHIHFGREYAMSIVARITAEGYMSPSPYIDVFFGDLKRESFALAWQKMRRAWAHPTLKSYLEQNVHCADGVISVAAANPILVE